MIEVSRFAIDGMMIEIDVIALTSELGGQRN